MSDKDWALYEKFICDPGGSTTAQAKRVFWAEHRPALLDDFVEFVDGCWQDNNSATDRGQ